MNRRNIILLVASLVALIYPTFAAVEQNRVLVLLDSLSQQHSHSKFFNGLKDRGYELSFYTADDPTLTLSEYGQFLYDHIVLFSPNIKEFGGLMDISSIIDFIDSGHNILIAADEHVSDPIRELAAEVGVEFDEEGKIVLDHLVNDIGDNDHGRLIVEVGSKLKPILGVEKAGPILYRGVGQTLAKKSVESGLLSTVLASRGSAYPAPKTTLISALQARNNARVVISGSLSLFSDNFFNSPVKSSDGSIEAAKSDNEKFCTELSKWVFKERGVLRYKNVKHHRVGESEAPEIYRVMDNITFSFDVEELSGGKWVPFVTDDIQLEFIMLDPYVRKFLKADKNGHYTLTFTVPDVYGVYTFRVDYHKFGYTSMFIETRTPVRPYRHNEYERFIEMAYPYYAGSFSMLVGIFLFSFVFLYHK